MNSCIWILLLLCCCGQNHGCGNSRGNTCCDTSTGRSGCGCEQNTRPVPPPPPRPPRPPYEDCGCNN